MDQMTERGLREGQRLDWDDKVIMSRWMEAGTKASLASGSLETCFCVRGCEKEIAALEISGKESSKCSMADREAG